LQAIRNGTDGAGEIACEQDPAKSRRSSLLETKAAKKNIFEGKA